ncbi:MAG: hypothetical protein JWM53_4713 [bacterium]|nr:hypothetical protein [bacterium]
MSIAELAQAVDRCVDELDRAQLADEYAPGASTPWLVTLERWRLFVTLVELIDRAVSNPFADGSSALLLTAAALHDDEVFQLAFGLSHTGEAISVARAQADSAD